MIYRALECYANFPDGKAWPEDWIQDAWVSAANREDAADKVRKILALIWDVPVESVETGSVEDEVELERNSVEALAEQPSGPKQRRWLQIGSLGSWPFYTSTLGAVVALNAQDRRKLADAENEAMHHRKELLESEPEYAKEDSYLKPFGG